MAEPLARFWVSVVCPHLREVLVEFLVNSEGDSDVIELLAVVLHVMRHERIYLLKTSALPGGSALYTRSRCHFHPYLDTRTSPFFADIRTTLLCLVDQDFQRTNKPSR